MRLLDCCKISNQSVSKYEGTKKYIATGDIINNNIVTYEEYYYDSKPSRANLQIEEGTVIFAKMKDTIKVLIGNKDNKNNIYSTGFCSLIPNDNILSKYLFYYLNSESFNKQKNKYSSGATQQAINNEKLKKIMIKEVPTLENQKEIINKLDTIMSLIEYKKRQIDKLNELVKSQFVEMFGDININSHNYQEEKLSNHLKIIGGYAFKSKNFKNKGIPVLRIGNINTGFFVSKNLMFYDDNPNLENYAIYPGDVVISLTGTVGKDDYGNVCIVGNKYDKYYLNQRNAKLELNNTVNSRYITYAFRIPEIKKRLTTVSRGVRQANISNKDIENLVIPIPPIDLQNKFADIVKQIDKQKFEFENSLKKLEELKNSLMQEYFG